MNRRQLLVGGGVGAAGVVGFTTLGASKTLSEPEVNHASDGRAHLQFTADGEEIGTLGFDGRVDDGRIELDSEIWHRKGTRVRSIELRVAMPPRETDARTNVAVGSPLEGDSSPPPEVTLSSPTDELGTVIAISDLDDLADETISTIDLVVEPGSAAATTVVIDGTIELASAAWLERDYRLTGELNLEFPELVGLASTADDDRSEAGNGGDEGDGDADANATRDASPQDSPTDRTEERS